MISSENTRRDLEATAVNVRRIENESVMQNSKIDNIQTANGNRNTEMENAWVTIKGEIDKRIEEMEKSISTAVTTNVATSSGSGSSKTFTLDTDKRLTSHPPITGNEDISTINEWWTKFFVKIESCVPMGKAYLEAIVSAQEEIGNQQIDARDDRMLGHRLNKELFSLLTSIASSKAWSAIKHIDSTRGLEALRIMYKVTTMRGPAQLQAEHRYLNSPSHKPQSASDLPQWIQEWEYRIDQLAMANRDYAIPDAQKRNTLYECLPSAIRLTVDAETGKGNLISYSSLKEFAKAVGTTEMLSKHKTPAPIALNMVDSPMKSDAPEWSQDEWMTWMQTDEGSEYARRNPEDKDVLQIIGSLTLQGKGGKFGGKGKSGGKGNKGDGKGKFGGRCWLCNQVGHTMRECPLNQKGGQWKGKGNKGAGKGGKGSLNAVTDYDMCLFLADEPPLMCIECTPCPPMKKNQWTNVGNKNITEEIMPVVNKKSKNFHNPNYFDFEVVDNGSVEDEEFILDPKEFPEATKANLIVQKKKKKVNWKDTEDEETKQLISELQDAVRMKVKNKKKVSKEEDTAPEDMKQLKPSPNLEKPIEDANQMSTTNRHQSLTNLFKAMCATETSNSIPKKSDVVDLWDQYKQNDIGNCTAVSNGQTIFMKSQMKQQSEIENMLQNSINIITDEQVGKSILNVGELKWAKIAIALDSGAVKHVTPANIFSVTTEPTEKSRSGHNYFGADGSAIPNLGAQKTSASDESGRTIALEFDVAKISRPLASVAEIVKKDHRVVFEDGASFIQSKRTGTWTPLRQEGNLFFLDVWVQVPESLTSNPFVRQVA